MLCLYFLMSQYLPILFGQKLCFIIFYVDGVKIAKMLVDPIRSLFGQCVGIERGFSQPSLENTGPMNY